jgi:hypothetical protein
VRFGPIDQGVGEHIEGPPILGRQRRGPPWRIGLLAHNARCDGLAVVVDANLDNLEIEADFLAVAAVLLLHDLGRPAAVALLDFDDGVGGAE